MILPFVLDGKYVHLHFFRAIGRHLILEYVSALLTVSLFNSVSCLIPLFRQFSYLIPLFRQFSYLIPLFREFGEKYPGLKTDTQPETDEIFGWTLWSVQNCSCVGS